MTLGMSRIISLGCVVIPVLIARLSAMEDISSSPSQTDEWVNPDDVFSFKSDYSSNDPPDSESPQCLKHVNGECEALLRRFAQRFATCERSLRSCKEVKDEQISIAEPSPSKSHMQCGGESSGSGAYLRRLVHRLLDVSSLINGEVEATHQMDLKLYITGDQLKALRQYAKEGDTKSVPNRQVDEIFTSVLVKPYIELPSLVTVANVLSKFKTHSFYMTAIFPAVWFFSVLLLTKSVWKSFVLLTPVAFVTSFITTASQMYYEAELELFKKEEYYGDLYITPLKILNRMFGEFVSDGFAHFGRATFQFMAVFNGAWFFDKWWMIPTAFAVLISFLILLLLYCSGGSIRFPLFLGGLHFYQQKETVKSTPDMRKLKVSTSAEAVPPQPSNITINFNSHSPASIRHILQSIPTGVTLPFSPSLQTASIEDAVEVQRNPPAFAAVMSNPAAGDAPPHDKSQEHIKDEVFTFKANNKPNHGSSSKNNSKQFRYLQAKYKSGYRQRHKSL